MVRKKESAAKHDVTFSYCGERFTVSASGTIRDAWEAAAPDLGADASRPVTFKSDGNLLSGTTPLSPGLTLAVATKHDDKAHID